jgi:hypothetical protein
MKWIGVFLAMAALDYVWAKYTHAVTDRYINRASTYATLIILCNGFVVIEYVKDYWLLIPTAAGAYVGTWIAIKTSA